MPDTAKLSDFAFINPATDTNGTAAEAPVAFIPMAAVSEGGGWRSTENRPLSDGRRGYTLFQRGDVIVAKITPCFENGKVALLSDLETDYGLGSTEFHVLRAKPGHDPRFIYHWTRHPAFLRAGEASMTGSAGQRRVPTGFFERFGIVKIEGAPQGLIADILDAIDDAIIAADAVVEKLNLVREGLVQDLLTFGIREDGSSRNREALGATRLGLRPKDWAICQIGEIAVHVGSGATPRGGKDVYVDDGALFVRSQNVHFDGLRLDDRTFITLDTHRAMSGSEIFENDVLLNITGASIGRCCAFLGYNGPANVNQHVCAIRVPKATRADALYLSACLSADIGQRQIRTLLAGGSREGLNFGHVRSMVVPWPDAEERARIARALEAIDRRITEEKTTGAKLEVLQLGLQDDLLNGRIEVVTVREAAE